MQQEGIWQTADGAKTKGLGPRSTTLLQQLHLFVSWSWKQTKTVFNIKSQGFGNNLLLILLILKKREIFRNVIAPF